MDFLDVLSDFPKDYVRDSIYSKKAEDVKRAISTSRPSLQDFMALLSPEADKFLEQMATMAHSITKRRFGNIILLFTPLYISNECINSCIYCAFCKKNSIERKTLSLKEIEREAQLLHDRGFRHILVLTGEHPKKAGVDYLEAAINVIRPLFSSIAIEVFPMDQEGYNRMVGAGVDGLTVYQETYDKEVYSHVHPAGPKKNYDFRITAPERGAIAGMRRLGLGVLLGLTDFRLDSFYLGLHAMYLAKHYWKCHITISFPRLRPAAGGFEPPFPVSDRHLVQLICAMRILMPDVGLVISTREGPSLRDNLIPLGITQMSAGSKTSPGGYLTHPESTEQFEIEDRRSISEICSVINQKGYEPVWKDWDHAFLG